FRCRMLGLFADLFREELNGQREGVAMRKDAKGRLRELVGQIGEAELLEHSTEGLARLLCCSERHLSRLFREEFGVSLRTKQTELRLRKAKRLLAETDAKVINVALESGYRHLGLFNLMFKRRFGVTPTQWRNQSRKKKSFKIIRVQNAFLVF